MKKAIWKENQILIRFGTSILPDQILHLVISETKKRYWWMPAQFEQIDKLMIISKKIIQLFKNSKFAYSYLGFNLKMRNSKI